MPNKVNDNSYFSLDNIGMTKTKRMGLTVHGRDKKCMQSLVGKPVGTRLLNRKQRRSKYNIKSDF
jgi:hypothetical protein